MKPRRGEIWLADLNPVRGSEQSGIRPVLIFQNDALNAFTTTVLAIPLTTNIRRAKLASCVRIPNGEGGLTSDSVALCHQLRALDIARLYRKLGSIGPQTLIAIETRVLFSLGII